MSSSTKAHSPLPTSTRRACWWPRRLAHAAARARALFSLGPPARGPEKLALPSTPHGWSPTDCGAARRGAPIEVLTAITCAPISRTIRAIRSEVEVGAAEGLIDRSVISCDNLISIPIRLFDAEPVGHIDLDIRTRLDQALRYALDIEY